MAEHHIGSLIITGAYGITGIFTERDLMMYVVGEGLDPARITVGEVIRPTLLRVHPDETVARCLELMKDQRCRHLTVFDGERFIGIVSLRDMVALMLDEKEALIARLTEYISA